MRKRERERRGNFRIILVCAPSSIIASTLLNVAHLKNYFSFFPLSLSLLCYFLLLLVFLLIFSSSLLLPSLSLSLASFNYMKRDSTRGRCDKRGNNDERRIVLSLSKLEEGGVPLFLLPSPFSRFFLRFFFPAIERASGRTRIHADAALNLKQRKTTRGKNDGIRRRERERERDKGMKSKIFTARYFAENARQ